MNTNSQGKNLTLYPLCSIFRLGKSVTLLLLLLPVQLAVGQKAVVAVPTPVAESLVLDRIKFDRLGKNGEAGTWEQREQTTLKNQFSGLLDKSNYICPAHLNGSIETIINRPEFRYSRWGILIETLSSETTLYSHEDQRYFIPASNVKLLTTAAALSQLGGEFRIKTSVYGTNNNSTTLRVVGRGDPSLTDNELKELAAQLKSRGINRVEKLIVEDGYFSEPSINPTWEWEDVFAYYGAPVNSLILNQNAVLLTTTPPKLGQSLNITWSDRIAANQWQLDNETITAEAGAPSSVEVVGFLGKPILQIRGQMGIDAEPMVTAVAIRDPGTYFLQKFQNILTSTGIRVMQGSVGSNPNPNNDIELAAIASPPLATLLVEINQQSNNIYAEALLRTLGTTQPVAGESTAEVGIQQVKAILTQLGIDPKSYVQADGSGLSRRNLVSPVALVETLQAIAKTPVANIYRASLPVAGVSGTLRNRFVNTPAQGILQAKTGTMTGASALSGYLDVPNYQTLVFSIIVNQSDQSVTTLRQAIDEIVLLLTRLHSC